MKIAIYARYSTDNQNYKSTQDQIKECRNFISKNFDNVSEIYVYQDKALSGQYSTKRQGYLDLENGIRKREFDIVVSEALDRISRSLSNVSQLYKLTEYYDVKIHTIAEGKINHLHIGLQGTINEMYCASTGRQVHRAQKARAKEGAMFGLPYGYKIKIENGREVTGQREIDREKAQHVLTIFELFAKGHSLPSICEILNGNEIPSPRGSLWTKHSLLGSKKRREGILNNEIYIGNIIWNRRSLKVNPETEGVSYPVNDRKDWVITHNEGLRIISDDLWHTCETLKSKPKVTKPRKDRVINPLRGLLFCAICKGHKNIANNRRYVCANYRQYRTCTNARGMNYDLIIEKLFVHLREELAKQVSRGIVLTLTVQSSEQQQQLNKINEIIKKLTNSIDDDVIDIPEITDKITELNKKRKSIKKRISSYTLKNENVKNLLRQGLEDLENALLEEQKTDNCRVLLKLILRSIIFTPTKKRTGEKMRIVLHKDWCSDLYEALQK